MTINLNILFRNLQQLLTRRLQGVAYFLDKLLSHKYVLFLLIWDVAFLTTTLLKIYIINVYAH